MKRIFKNIVQELSALSEIKMIVLYGSFARGEESSRSDIDLLILTSRKNSYDEIQNKIIELESKIQRTIQPTIRTKDELQKTDTGLLQNIFKEGKVLYLKEPTEIPSALLLEQKPYIIYTFQIKHLSQKDKVKFNRSFYEQTRGNYRYEGLLNELNGEKISPGCIIIPQVKKDHVEKFFKKYAVSFEQIEVWK